MGMCPKYLRNKSKARRRMNEWAVRMGGCPRSLQWLTGHMRDSG